MRRIINRLRGGRAAGLRAELTKERDENEIGSLAETAKVWHQRCLEAEDERRQRDAQIAILRTRLAQAENRAREIKLSYVGTNRRPLPEPVQALIDWHLRESVTAVLAQPSRDSVRAALEAWQPAPVAGVCEKCHQRPVWKRASQWLDGHFCEPCISDCHEQVEGHMCLIDRWRPSMPVTTSPRQE